MSHISQREASGKPGARSKGAKPSLDQVHQVVVGSIVLDQQLVTSLLRYQLLGCEIVLKLTDKSDVIEMVARRRV